MKSVLKSVAFTLAETLIVIGIIGIVSALTLPNLNNSTGDKERIAKVKKIYQNLNDAFTRAEAVYGPFAEWIKDTDDSNEKKVKRIGERITEFMKISKNCETGTYNGCFSPEDSVLGLYGTSQFGTPEKFNTEYKIITADGISVAFLVGGSIYVDIDGPSKGKSVFGKDFFMFSIVEDKGILPRGYNNCFNETVNLLVFEMTGFEGMYASCWILRFDNADYLKLDKNGKCPNGAAPSDENPRCK